jgi:hypothetical protein
MKQKTDKPSKFNPKNGYYIKHKGVSYVFYNSPRSYTDEHLKLSSIITFSTTIAFKNTTNSRKSEIKLFQWLIENVKVLPSYEFLLTLNNVVYICQNGNTTMPHTKNN